MRESSFPPSPSFQASSSAVVNAIRVSEAGGRGSLLRVAPLSVAQGRNTRGKVRKVYFYSVPESSVHIMKIVSFLPLPETDEDVSRDAVEKRAYLKCRNPSFPK